MSAILLTPGGRGPELGSKIDFPCLAKHESQILVEFNLPVFYGLSVVHLHRRQKRKQGEREFQRIRRVASWNFELEGHLYRNIWALFT